MSGISFGRRVNELLRNDHTKANEPKSFIDLGSIPMESDENGDTRIKIAEIREFGDLPAVADLAYKGNILFIDCTSISSDKEEMRRLSKELNSIARDCNGDAVMMANRFIILSSGGVKIDRTRIRQRKKE